MVVLREKACLRFFSVVCVATLFGCGSAFAWGGEPEPWVAPDSAKELANPIKNAKKAAKKGAKTFKQFCVLCHGPKGKGDGPGGKSLTPKPADLSSDRVQGQEDGEIFWKISEGRPPMVTWKHSISETERWNLVHYIRTFKPQP